jgi:hypothetical protein
VSRAPEAALQPETETGRLRFVVLMTDGYIARESEVFRVVHENLGQARVFGFVVFIAVDESSVVDVPSTTVQELSQVPAGVVGQTSAMAPSPTAVTTTATPSPLYAPATSSLMGAQRTRRRARRPSHGHARRSLEGGGSARQRCPDQARRPDGTIDQAVL